MNEREPIEIEDGADPCSLCGAQPMMTGTDGDKSYRCHCSGCPRTLVVTHWTEEDAIEAWNAAQVDEPDPPALCPYCGAGDHGAITAPTVTCTRHLWAIIGALRVERGVLRWALGNITDLVKPPNAEPDPVAIRRIIAAAHTQVELSAGGKGEE